ncbi:MAG: hypothetical protein EPO52_00345 [Herbiconiux sp.]|uniref:hypothetical protein n=1 Tax=Herbiconiux sp. TaxID=1871186 RepID=UPI00120D3394|nr:hypothetical protein [Herbiconiux sp.]TAJ50304.1 MAG: hypothetical protein EPO52_00345 [Herbiconiux sp.]
MGIRSGFALAGVALTVVLGASGCVGSTPAPTVTVTVTPSAGPTPTPTPTVAPTPTTAAFSADDPGTWIIDGAGIGPFVVGSTLADIESQVPAAVETCRAGVDTYSLDGLGLTAVSGIDESDPSAPVQVVRMLRIDGYDPSAPQPHTEKGISLASSVDELLAAYPGIEQYSGKQGNAIYRLAEGSEYIHFEGSDDGGLSIISVTDSQQVGFEYCGA